jgi:hypothetical protein
MPLIIPPFTQFQAPLFPLRGLWNATPPEGDKYIAAEVDWGSYPPGQAVQFALSGNSPVALSQIVALSVDNSRCGTDVRFVFTDSGFTLVVPAHAGGVFPVFTNGLMFYAIALTAGASDVTSLNVHNSMPPPLALQLSSQQNYVSAAVPAPVNGTYPIIAAPISGTLNDADIIIDYLIGASAQRMTLTLQDGRPVALWSTTFSAPAAAEGIQHIELSGLNSRFINGLSLVISASTLTQNGVTVNAYYTTP